MTRPTTRVARHALAYASASVVGGITRAVLLPVIARTLAPEEYGVLNLLLSVTNLLHLAFELGLVTSLIKFHSETEDERERLRLRATLFVFLPLFDLIPAGLVLLLRGQASRVLFGTEAYAGLVAITVCAAFWGAQFQLFLGHLRARDRSTAFAVLMATKGAISLSATLLLVFVGDLGIVGFLLGNLAGPTAVTLVMTPRLLLRAGVDLTGWRTRMRRLLSFGLPLVPAALGLWALGYLDVWLLRVLADLDSVGIYGFGSDLCLPVGLLLTSIQLAWPSFAFGRARAEGGAEEVARVFRHLFVVLVGGALAIAVLRRELLAVLGTATYERSQAVIPALALATCIYGVAQTFATGLQVAGDTRRLPLLVLGAVGVNAFLNFLAIPRWQELGAAWATVVTNILLAIVVRAESNRQFRIPFDVGGMVRVLVAAAVALAGAEAAGALPAAAAAAVRVALLLAFPLLLVPAGALSSSELRVLPAVVREMLARRTA